MRKLNYSKTLFLISAILLIMFLFISSSKGEENGPASAGEDKTISQSTIKNILEKARVYKDDIHSYKAAEEEYLNIIKYSSKNPKTQNNFFAEAYEGYIECARKQGKLKEAIKYFEENMEKDPDIPGWYFALALSYLPDIEYEITDETLAELENVKFADNKVFDEDDLTSLSSFKGEKFFYPEIIANLEKFKIKEYKIPDILKYCRKYNAEKVVENFNKTLTLTRKDRPYIYKFTENTGIERGLGLTGGTPPIPPYSYLLAILVFALIASVIYFFLQKGVIEKIVKLEGNFEVYSPSGLKAYVLDCNDKKFLKKGGDRITIGSEKGCDFRLKVKGEKETYAVIEPERMDEINRVVIVPSEGAEIFLEVPRSRYTPDETVKLPFKGGPLWDKDIINIKDYQIHYHSVKTGKRLYKDYPEEARGYIFIDDEGEIDKIEVPDAELFKQVLPPEDDDIYQTEEFYQPYEKVKEAVSSIMKEEEGRRGGRGTCL